MKKYFGVINVVLILILMMIILRINNDYNLINASSPNRGGRSFGSEIFVEIDYLGGKKWVFIALYSIILLLLVDVYRKYIILNYDLTKRTKCILKFIKTVNFIWLFTFIILISVLTIIKINKNNKDIQRRGIETVTYVLKIDYNSPYAYKNQYDATLIYYVNDSLVEKTYPRLYGKRVHKFYKIKYLLENSKKIVVDFKSEIPIDSVYKFFTFGKNPFEEEIKKLKQQQEENKKYNGYILK